MASIPVSVDNLDTPHEGDNNGQFIRVIVADTQAIFRAGLRKIFALEDDIRVVGQAETLAQTLAAAKKFSADVLIFEAALTPNPMEAVADLLRQAPQMKMVVVTHEPNEELTLELFRRGAHGIVSREVEPETLVECLRKVSQGEPWLDRQGVSWWYVGPRNGHISIFSKQALAMTWARHGYRTVSFNAGTHLAYRTLPESWGLKTPQN